MLVSTTCGFAVQRHGIARVAPFSAVFYVARTTRATFYVLRAPQARKSWLSTNATRRTWRLTSFRALPTKKDPVAGALADQMVPPAGCPRSRFAGPRAPRGVRPSRASPGNARAFPRLGPCRVRIPPRWGRPRKRPRSRGLVRAHGALCGIRTRDLSLRRRTLYPAELRELAWDSIRHSAPSSKSAWSVWVGFSSVSTRFGRPGRALTPYNEHSHAPARAPHRLEPP